MRRTVLPQVDGTRRRTVDPPGRAPRPTVRTTPPRTRVPMPARSRIRTCTHLAEESDPASEYAPAPGPCGKPRGAL